MNYDRIDVLDTGVVWQGGAVDQSINAPPFTNTLIVCMDRGELDESFIDHNTVQAVLAVWIDDTPTGFGPLPDATLKGLAETGKAWLASGGNIYVHCFPTGTLVDAPVPAPIETAEEVIGHDGRRHKVLARSQRPYAGPLTVIESTGTLPLRCTPEHPVLAVQPYRGRRARAYKPSWAIRDKGDDAIMAYYEALVPAWVKAQDLRPGDFLVAPPLATNDDPVAVSWIVNGSRNRRVVAELEPDWETAWMIGQYVADGGTRGQDGIGFTTSRRNDAARLAAIWRRYGLHPIVTDHSTYQRVCVPSRTVSETFGRWCGKGQDKRFPAFLFDGWPLDAALQGYLAGDGHLSKNGAWAAQTISPVLARQLHMILRALRESPTMRPVRRHSGYPNAKKSITVRFSPAATQRQTAWWHDLYLMPVTSVSEEFYVGLVHNLEVADAETYTVAGVTVHNCAAGISRASYYDVALHCVCNGWSAQTALAAIQAARPVADPNPGFWAQLTRLWP